MKYQIFHDESKQDGFWHIYLFVPEVFKQELVSSLKSAREIMDFDGEVHFSKLDIAAKRIFNVCSSWLSIAIASFQQIEKGDLMPFWIGKQRYHMYEFQKRDAGQFLQIFGQVPKVKIVVFRQDMDHEDMGGHFDDLSKMETTFRMGLQGACHYLFSQASPIEISRIVLDGEEHYEILHGREFHADKILKKLDMKFRGYCSLSDACVVTGTELDDEDSEILQLADLLLGCFRAGIVRPSLSECETENEKAKFDLCKILKRFLDDKLNKGEARMANSRFNKFGVFSSSKIIDEKWEFASIHQDFLRKPQQGSLFD